MKLLNGRIYFPSTMTRAYGLLVQRATSCPYFPALTVCKDSHHSVAAGLGKCINGNKLCQ
eukprot:scaffold216151_cov20-Prasinocladus_malaysianus.AAC.1